MKDAYWFKHDSNASRDLKLLQIKAIHGFEGLGIFWAVVEVLREQAGYSWEDSQIQILAKVIDCDLPKLNNFITDCKRIGLLKSNGSSFFSERLINDMEVWETKKNNRLKSKRLQNNETRTELERNKNGTQTKTEDKIRVEERRVYVDIPSENETETYFKQKGKPDYKLFFLYYKKRNWKGIENWRAAADEWILRGENAQPKATW